ncbi:hypothetical protein AM592_03725 [Bacillus gobiensis]|uniref:Uncharacterized protein n=1 Tax=Bacillus gobiensis TaxID=1441095 RepID=A0A0M4FS83_9BACI|nr:hypothetical protein AM592_03725 [Bacillus gobiensis]
MNELSKTITTNKHSLKRVLFVCPKHGGNAIANGEISQLRSDNGELGTQSLVVVTAVFVAGILAGFIVDGVVIYSRLLVWSMGRNFISVWFTCR